MIQKMFLLVFLLIVSIASFSTAAERDIVSNLEGRIFFLKRDGKILNLYTSDANLSNIKMLYSHKGKGGQNDNIVDFYYDIEKDLICFQAMKEGSWALYSIRIGSNEPVLIKPIIGFKEVMREDHYIKPEIGEIKALNKRGSLYLVNKEKEDLLKKYYGFYDGKFAEGYVPVGFSPDKKYLVYFWNGHRTVYGTILAGFFKQQLFHSHNVGSLYILDLGTKKSSKYIPAYRRSIQWVMENKQES